MAISRKQRANAIRALAMDAVEKANSGHPGMPMGMADIAEVLWNDFLCHNPNNPHWFNRDRFILSNGHGSMLLYALLHLTGYQLSLDELKNFRQWGSKTPGHPEYGHTPGVETTTGPLGQGLANAVGMSLAEKLLAKEFNKDICLVNHFTYCFVGDGCLMEGISHEASSLAGTLGLNKLIVFWDQNGISIDGAVDNWFDEHTADRFKAYGWHVIESVDGHDAEQIKIAIISAQSNETQPTLICCKTVIGYGAPKKSGSAASHGNPLGADEIREAKKKLDWEYEAFEIPQEIYTSWDNRQQGQEQEQAWQKLQQLYQKQYTELAKIFNQRISGQLPQNWQTLINDNFTKACKQPSQASRQASKWALQQLASHVPGLFGGSADLSNSNLTKYEQAKTIIPRIFQGNYLHYGVREFAMCAMMNGLSLHGGFIPYGGTFLVFADYAKNAIRLSALMGIRVIYVFSHDSIGLGEDGPTHQPIEQLSMLRATPNLNIWRPCDVAETMVAWHQAITSQNTPTCLSLSRQKLENQIHKPEQQKLIAKGAYILKDFGTQPQLVLMASGSEVTLILQAAQKLNDDGISVRVVSVPCLDVFNQQDHSYQKDILPDNIPRIAVEAAASMPWWRWVKQGDIIALDRFGASAPSQDIYDNLGLTVDRIYRVAQKQLKLVKEELMYS